MDLGWGSFSGSTGIRGKMMPIYSDLSMDGNDGNCVNVASNTKMDKDNCYLYAYLQETLCNTPYYMQKQCKDYAFLSGEDTTACTTNSDKRSGFLDAEHDYGYSYTGTYHEEYNTSAPWTYVGNQDTGIFGKTCLDWSTVNVTEFYAHYSSSWNLTVNASEIESEFGAISSNLCKFHPLVFHGAKNFHF